MQKEITRKEFLKKTICLAACPLLFNTFVSSCGPVGDGEKANDELVIGGGNGNLERIEQSHYNEMKVGDKKALTLSDKENTEIILVKSSEKEFKAFRPVCPHQDGTINISSNQEELGVCAFHGARFNMSGKGTSGPAAGKSLISYTITSKDDHLLVDI